MEQKVEGAVDKWLESISSGLYLYSIAFGIVLVILGVFLLFKKRGAKGNKTVFYGSLACLVLGLIAIASGFMQM